MFKPLGLPDVTNNISGESGVEAPLTIFSEAMEQKVKNKWDSYDIDAELKKHEVDSDEDKNSSEVKRQMYPHCWTKNIPEIKTCKKNIRQSSKSKTKAGKVTAEA